MSNDIKGLLNSRDENGVDSVTIDDVLNGEFPLSLHRYEAPRHHKNILIEVN